LFVNYFLLFASRKLVSRPRPELGEGQPSLGRNWDQFSARSVETFCHIYKQWLDESAAVDQDDSTPHMLLSLMQMHSGHLTLLQGECQLPKFPTTQTYGARQPHVWLYQKFLVIVW